MKSFYFQSIEKRFLFKKSYPIFIALHQTILQEIIKSLSMPIRTLKCIEFHLKLYEIAQLPICSQTSWITEHTKSLVLTWKILIPRGNQFEFRGNLISLTNLKEIKNSCRISIDIYQNFTGALQRFATELCLDYKKKLL